MSTSIRNKKRNIKTEQAEKNSFLKAIDKVSPTQKRNEDQENNINALKNNDIVFNHNNEERNVLVMLHNHNESEDNEIKENDNFFRPREEYLKQKIEEMNVSKDISIAVEQGISNTIMDIKQNFITNSEYQGLSLSSSVPNILGRNQKHQAALTISVSALNTSKSRRHIIKELKNDELRLQKTIYMLINNKKALEEESSINISIKGMNSIVESVLKTKIKKIKNEIDLLTERLCHNTMKIKELLEEEKNEVGITSDKIATNLLQLQHNLESNTQRNLLHLIKLQKESKSRQQIRLNDINAKQELKQNQIELKEKEEKEHKLKKLSQLKQEEKKIIEKRKRNQSEISKQIEAIEIKDKKKNRIKTYGYIDLDKKYVLSEKLLLQKENMKRRENMKPIISAELNEFGHNYDLNKKKLSLKLSTKGDKLIELWKERSQLHPNYVHPLVHKYSNEHLLQKEKEEERQDNIQRYIILKKQYGETIIHPKPNESLKMKRMKNVTNLNIKLSLQNKKQYSPSNSFSVARMKRDFSCPMLHNTEKGQIISNDYTKKPKKVYIKLKQREIQQIKPLDFLEEQRKIKAKVHDWNTIIMKEKDKSSLVNRVINVKNKIHTIDVKIKQHSKLLRLNGGVKVHPEINSEVNNLLIKSIKGKLSILDNLYPTIT